MLSCRDATRLLSESQERRLTLQEKTGLRLHVLMCPHCRHCQQHMTTLRQAARQFARGVNQEHSD